MAVVWKDICNKLQLLEEVSQALAAEASPLAPGDGGICLQLVAKRRREKRLAWKTEEVKVEQRFEFGCGKQSKCYKGREKHVSPRGRKVRNTPVVSKNKVVAAGEEGKITTYRT